MVEYNIIAVNDSNTIELINNLNTAELVNNPNGIELVNNPNTIVIQNSTIGYLPNHNYTHFTGGSDPITPENIGAQNAWESPVFTGNSFTAQKNKHYIIKSQIAITPTVFTIVDPPTASIGDFYVVYHEGGPFISIGGTTYLSPGTLLFRVYAASGLSGQWTTQTVITPQALVKAWVNYNGISRTIRNSYNISSVTYNSTGSYTINFATPFTNTNYSIIAFARDFDSDSYVANLASLRANSAKSTTSISLTSCYIRTGVLYDSPEFNVAIFS